MFAQRVIGQPSHQYHRAIQHRGAVRPAQVSTAVRACQVNHPARVQWAALHRHRNGLVLHCGTLPRVHHGPQLAAAFKRVLIHQTALGLLHCFSGVKKQHRGVCTSGCCIKLRTAQAQRVICAQTHLVSHQCELAAVRHTPIEPCIAHTATGGAVYTITVGAELAHTHCVT